MRARRGGAVVEVLCAERVERRGEGGAPLGDEGLVHATYHLVGVEEDLRAKTMARNVWAASSSARGHRQAERR